MCTYYDSVTQICSFVSNYSSAFPLMDVLYVIQILIMYTLNHNKIYLYLFYPKILFYPGCTLKNIKSSTIIYYLEQFVDAELEVLVVYFFVDFCELFGEVVDALKGFNYVVPPGFGVHVMVEVHEVLKGGKYVF